MTKSADPATLTIETVRRENKIAVRKVREFIERFKEIQDYERAISDQTPTESKPVSPTSKP